jgi:hypothetical protein
MIVKAKPDRGGLDLGAHLRGLPPRKENWAFEIGYWAFEKACLILIQLSFIFLFYFILSFF